MNLRTGLFATFLLAGCGIFDFKQERGEEQGLGVEILYMMLIPGQDSVFWAKEGFA